MTNLEYYRALCKIWDSSVTDEQVKALYSDMNLDWNGYWKE